MTALKLKNIQLPIVLGTFYWAICTIAFIMAIHGQIEAIPVWLDRYLFPGYVIGFWLAFTKGQLMGYFGQLLSLFAICAVLVIFHLVIRKVRGVA